MLLGDFLIQQKAITQEQLQKALEYQREHPDIKIGEALIVLGFATDKDVEDAMKKISGRG